MPKLYFLTIILLLSPILAAQSLTPVTDPYTIRIYYKLWDTPEHVRLEKWFQQEWQEYLPVGAGHSFQLEFVTDGEQAEKLLTIHKISELNAEWLAQQPELVIALTASIADGRAALRTWDTRTQRLSPKVEIQFTTPQLMAQQAVKEMLLLFGFEAQLVRPADTKNERNWVVQFRGSASDLAQLQVAKPGTCFWIFSQRRRLADSLLILQSTHANGTNLDGIMEYKGNQRLLPGMQAIQIYFTGGEQRFRLINQNQKPQAGFSIFASYQDFAMESNHYRGTTDNTGEFTINDPEQKPIFLVIAKNVEDINFAFFRKLLVIQNDMTDVQSIVISDAEVAAQEAQEITPQKILQRKQQELQRTISMRLEQAREHIQKQELPSALKAIQLAEQSLVGLPDDQRMSLSRTLKEVEEVYQTALMHRQAKENYTAACQLLEEADTLVTKLDYVEAQARIQRAQELWPMQFYEQEFAEVQTRSTRLQELIKEAEAPLGQARSYILETGLTLKPEQADTAALNQLYPQLKILYSQGVMDKEKQYNDVELWLKIKLFLNDLSQQQMKASQEYLSLYQKATSVQQRSDLLQKHQQFHQWSRTIDTWLQEMK